MAEDSGFVKMIKKSVHVLDEDCWEYIFSRLDYSHDIASVSLVSKNFLSISSRTVNNLRVSELTAPLIPKLLQRFHLLKSIEIASYSQVDCNDTLCQISRSGLKHFEALVIPHSVKFPRQGLRELAMNMNCLKKLKFSRYNDCCDDDLIALGDWFPTLEEFYFENCTVNPYPNITDTGLKGLVSKLKMLKKISLSCCVEITDESLVSISSNCPNLTHFDVFACPRLTEYGYGYLMRHCCRLTSLSVDVCGKPESFNFEYPFSVENSIPYARNLENIYFKGSSVSDGVLHAVVKSCPKVMKVNFSPAESPNNLSIQGLTYLVRVCSSLRDITLSIEWLTDKYLLEISQHLRDLNQLDLSGCDNLSSASFFMLMKTCTLLKSLKLSVYSEGTCGSYDVDVHRNYHVKELVLDWGTKVDDQKVNDQTLVKYLSVCPNLQYLSLKDFSDEPVTNEGIAECLGICPYLLHLDVSLLNVSNFMGQNEETKLKLKCIEAFHTGINEESLEAIANRCPDLESLNILGCDLVTNRGLKLIASKCEKLKQIDIRGCENVSIDLLDMIVKLRPSLKKIIAPFVITKEQRDLFLREGCYVTEK